MKQVNGVWLPDHEEHLYAYAENGPIGEWTYQKNKLDAAIKFCRKRDLAVDVGGHCGLWAREMCKLFGHVHSFEPVKDHRDCYSLNQRSENYTLYPYALGEKDGRACTKTKQGSSGDTWLVPGSRIEVKTLDWFDLAPDFVKIDTEGYELFVLKGAEKTLRKHRPVVIVEQKPGHASRNFGLGDTEAVDWLKTLGYKLQVEILGDYILT
jgi:FkbM family methyltransferase